MKPGETHLSPQPSLVRAARKIAINEQKTSVFSPLAPVEGERVRVRGLRRTRTGGARNFARHLRREYTDAEKRLWRHLHYGFAEKDSDPLSAALGRFVVTRRPAK